MPTVAFIGASSGKTTSQKTFQVEQPSSRALFSSSGGMDRMNAEYSSTLNESPNRMCRVATPVWPAVLSRVRIGQSGADSAGTSRRFTRCGRPDPIVDGNGVAVDIAVYRRGIRKIIQAPKCPRAEARGHLSNECPTPVRTGWAGGCSDQQA